MKKYNGKNIETRVLYVLFPILIIVGKIIRHTIMKESLVDTGVGHTFINQILCGSFSFKLLDVDTMSSHVGGNTIVIYKILDIFKLSTYIEWEIYISILWNILLLIIISRLGKTLKTNQFIFVALSVIVLNIFDFTLAKEPIQMLYFVVIYAVLCSRNITYRTKYVYTIGIVLFAVFTFRSYYILVVAFMLMAHFLCNIFIIGKNKVKIKDIFFIFCIIAIFYCVFLTVMKIKMPEQYQELIRVRTRTSNAVTDMRNIFHTTNLFVFSVDYLIMLIRMMFPVELIRLGVKYIAYVIYQFLVTFYIIKSVKRIKSNGKSKNIALFLYIGFLFASAAFEPDFGSWIRHEAVLFPIMLVVSDVKVIEEKKNEECKNEEN